MFRMGKHSPPVDGVPVANGHAPALVPFTVPAMAPRQGAPVSPWPQPDVTPDDSDRWWRHFTSAARAVFAHRGWLAAVPVVLVNTVAFSGQLAFLRHHLPWTPAGQVLVAVTLESVAVYLAWQAHLALAADDSALRLRLAAYGFAAVIGVMNYSHYMAPHWRPTFASVTFGLMSLSSPWLWSVHSRRQSRDALKAKGLIEPHAVRLGATRWTWHPLRSARVMFRATWRGENDPAKAVLLPPVKAAEETAGDVTASAAEVTPAPAPEAAPAPPVHVTSEPVSRQAPSQVEEPVSRQPEVTPPAAPQVRPRRKPAAKTEVRPSRITDADLKAEIRSLFDADKSVTVSAAAKATGRSRDRVRPLLEQVRAEAAPGGQE